MTITPDTQTRLLALAAAALPVALLFILQATMDIHGTAYWACHVLAFAWWAPLMYAMSLSRVAALASSLGWILGHELITDPLSRLAVEPAAGYWVQYDHIAAGVAGMAIGLAVIELITRMVARRQMVDQSAAGACG